MKAWLTPTTKFNMVALMSFFVIDIVFRYFGLGLEYAILAYMLLFMRPIEVPEWFRKRCSEQPEWARKQDLGE